MDCTPWTTQSPAAVRRAAIGSMCIGLKSPDTSANACWSSNENRRTAVGAITSGARHRLRLTDELHEVTDVFHVVELLRLHLHAEMAFDRHQNFYHFV